MENRTGDTKNVLGIHFSVFFQIVGVEKNSIGVFVPAVTEVSGCIGIFIDLHGLGPSGHESIWKVEYKADLRGISVDFHGLGQNPFRR